MSRTAISTYLRAAVSVSSLAVLASAGGQIRSPNQGPFRGALGVQSESQIEAQRPPAGPQDPLGGGMAAQAVSGPVLELILALFWTPRNRENRAPVEARGYFSPKSPHALGRSKSTPKWSNIEPQSGPKTSPGGLRRGTHAVPQRCSTLALRPKRFWTIWEPKRGSQMDPRIGPKSALAPKGRPEAPGALWGPILGHFWTLFGTHFGASGSGGWFSSNRNGNGGNGSRNPYHHRHRNRHRSRLMALSSAAFGFTLSLIHISEPTRP